MQRHNKVIKPMFPYGFAPLPISFPDTEARLDRERREAMEKRKLKAVRSAVKVAESISEALSIIQDNGGDVELPEAEVAAAIIGLQRAQRLADDLIRMINIGNLRSASRGTKLQ
jgi:hypothetical protein